MTSQTRQQIVTIYIFNIYIYIYSSGSKGNQTMKFGQLIEYSMRNIILEKSYLRFWVICVL